jgi:hypothetical protein
VGRELASRCGGDEKMARQATNFEITMLYFLEQKRCKRERPQRGYWTDGKSMMLDNNTIAVWSKGAVYMYLDEPRWHGYMLASAIVKIREWCEREKVLAHRKYIVCKEHTDCRNSFKLGRACGQRFASLPALRGLE